MSAKPRKSLSFADEHVRSWWTDGNEETVDDVVATRRARYTDGSVRLSRFEFVVDEKSQPLLLHRGGDIMHFSRIAWARFCHALGINREFVRERLAQGELGREFLAKLVNDILQKEKRGLRRNVFLYEVRPGLHVIRDCAIEQAGPLPDEGKLWEYLRGNKWWPTAEQPKLLGARLTDYSHSFRYLMMPADGPKKTAALVDICASTIRRTHYVQGILAIPVGPRIIPCRVDHNEIGGQNATHQLTAMPDAVRISLDATLDYVPAFLGKWQNRDWPDDGVEVLAAVRTASMKRSLPRDARRLVMKRIERASWSREPTIPLALECLFEASRHDTDQPETANRMERVMHDLATGEYLIREVDRAEAYAILKEAPKQMPDPDTKSWPAAMGG